MIKNKFFLMLLSYSLCIMCVVGFKVDKNTYMAMTESWLEFAATGFAGGNGSEGSPYQIASASQLALLSLNSRKDVGKNSFYELTNDINLSGKNWFPIKDFRGSFDGKNHNILNLTQHNLPNELFYGLFHSIVNAKVKNFRISNVSIVAESRINNAGCLSGWIEKNGEVCIIENVVVDGKMTLGQLYDAGGLCGWSVGDVNISKCGVNVDIKVTGSGESVGHFIGDVKGSYPTIEKCFTFGNLRVNSSVSSVGGFIGELEVNIGDDWGQSPINFITIAGNIFGSNADAGNVVGFAKNNSNSGVKMSYISVVNANSNKVIGKGSAYNEYYYFEDLIGSISNLPNSEFAVSEDKNNNHPFLKWYYWQY